MLGTNINMRSKLLWNTSSRESGTRFISTKKRFFMASLYDKGKQERETIREVKSMIYFAKTIEKKGR